MKISFSATVLIHLIQLTGGLLACLNVTWLLEKFISLWSPHASITSCLPMMLLTSRQLLLANYWLVSALVIGTTFWNEHQGRGCWAIFKQHQNLIAYAAAEHPKKWLHASALYVGFAVSTEGHHLHSDSFSLGPSSIKGVIAWKWLYTCVSWKAPASLKKQAGDLLSELKGNLKAPCTYSIGAEHINTVTITTSKHNHRKLKQVIMPHSPADLLRLTLFLSRADPPKVSELNRLIVIPSIKEVQVHTQELSATF